MEISLKTPSENSKVLIEDGLFNKLGDLLKADYPNSRFVIITDVNLEKIYGEKLKTLLSGTSTGTSSDPLILTIPAGEASKNFQTVISLSEQLIKTGLTRHDVLIGFGGGVITDLAGFVASIYLRGMKYVAVPTSLVGMVDAAIGGKTGIDFHGKNLIGTFYLADSVLIDPSLLNSFADQKNMPGWGEVIKYGCIIDASLFDNLKTDPPDLSTIIQKSAQAKIDVVNQDYKESGLRKILNFGHTFGHAIESATKFRLTHDQAIAIGMVLANRVAQKLGKQSPEVAEKIRSTLATFSLPTELPDELILNDLVDLIKKDKKRQGHLIHFIIAPELGKSEIIPIKPEELVKLAI